MPKVNVEHSRRPTARQVAALASVSTSTVSLVANNKALGRVTAETRVRVERAIETLGYRVDAAARSLTTGTQLTAALVAPDLANPFYSRLALGVYDALAGEYQLVIVMSGLGREILRSSVDHVLSLGIDGMLVDAPSARLVRELKPHCPVVLLDAPGIETSEPRVVFDLEIGSASLAQHLTTLGHRRLAYLDGSTASPTFRVRSEAIRRLLAAAGGGVVEGGYVTSQVHIDDAARVFRFGIRRWLELGVTAMICATDVQAYGVLLAAHELGIKIPATLAVASWDDLPFSQVTSPPLTSVSLNAYDMGYVGARLLRQAIKQHGPAGLPVTLPAILHPRASTIGDDASNEVSNPDISPTGPDADLPQPRRSPSEASAPRLVDGRQGANLRRSGSVV